MRRADDYKCLIFSDAISTYKPSTRYALQIRVHAKFTSCDLTVFRMYTNEYRKWLFGIGILSIEFDPFKLLLVAICMILQRCQLEKLKKKAWRTHPISIVINIFLYFLESVKFWHTPFLYSVVDYIISHILCPDNNNAGYWRPYYAFVYNIVIHFRLTSWRQQVIFYACLKGRPNDDVGLRVVISYYIIKRRHYAFINNTVPSVTLHIFYGTRVKHCDIHTYPQILRSR